MSFSLFLVILFFFIFDYLLHLVITTINARKCHYDCSTCKNWDCQFHHCDRIRKKKFK